MAKTISAVLTGAIVTFVVLAAYALTTNVYSDTRDGRERGTAGRATEPTPPSTGSTGSPQAGSGQVTPPPSNASGGITSQTSGSVSTGGNTGGQVTTGDEHVEVFEINIGPTNSPPSLSGEDDESPPPTSEPPCGSDGRARTTCPTDDSRTR